MTKTEISSLIDPTKNLGSLKKRPLAVRSAAHLISQVKHGRQSRASPFHKWLSDRPSPGIQHNRLVLEGTGSHIRDNNILPNDPPGADQSRSRLLDNQAAQRHASIEKIIAVSALR